MSCNIASQSSLGTTLGSTIVVVRIGNHGIVEEKWTKGIWYTTFYRGRTFLLESLEDHGRPVGGDMTVLAAA